MSKYSLLSIISTLLCLASRNAAFPWHPLFCKLNSLWFISMRQTLHLENAIILRPSQPTLLLHLKVNILFVRPGCSASPQMINTCVLRFWLGLAPITMSHFHHFNRLKLAAISNHMLTGAVSPKAAEVRKPNLLD